MAVVAPAIAVAISRLAVAVAVAIAGAVALAVSMKRSFVGTCIECECVVCNSPQPGPHDVRAPVSEQALCYNIMRAHGAHGERSRCSLRNMPESICV